MFNPADTTRLPDPSYHSHDRGPPTAATHNQFTTLTNPLPADSHSIPLSSKNPTELVNIPPLLSSVHANSNPPVPPLLFSPSTTHQSLVSSLPPPTTLISPRHPSSPPPVLHLRLPSMALNNHPVQFSHSAISTATNTSTAQSVTKPTQRKKRISDHPNPSNSAKHIKKTDLTTSSSVPFNHTGVVQDSDFPPFDNRNQIHTTGLPSTVPTFADRLRTESKFDYVTDFNTKINLLDCNVPKTNSDTSTTWSRGTLTTQVPSCFFHFKVVEDVFQANHEFGHPYALQMSLFPR
eukprot:TRINITY_DN567_c0_g1_i5.p1 TRINITY_DN567_c0_g1~~TRINITY_DN567_c0_g1_i5.p1  ORF type:complete len:292 (+),score=22.22 TRINITY_DN567_c0_g1_i5:152-1027(+)